MLTNAEAGQYIPYPDFGKGGRLWVEVRSGWLMVDGGENLATAENGPRELWDKVSWALMKLPGIEVMNSSQFGKTLDTDDVEYSAQLNRKAKEGIEIDTVCGTSAEGVPTARGAYFDAESGLQVTQLTRAGRTTQAEDLLIGTLYSQYARRQTTLGGEARIAADGLAAYREANQSGRLFLLTGDVQDAVAGTSEVSLSELRPDEYKRSNE